MIPQAEYAVALMVINQHTRMPVDGIAQTRQILPPINMTSSQLIREVRNRTAMGGLTRGDSVRNE
jgi:hypothetical protein